MYTNYPDPFLHLLFVILIVALIIWILRAVFMPRHMRHHNNMRWMGGRSPALTILEERYAKGEITKEDFDARRKDLMGS